MGLQRERIDADAAARRLRSLQEPAGARERRLQPPCPPAVPADRAGARKTSMGELSGVRARDADITVEQRMRRTSPRLGFTPGHALAAILLLVAVTCASLTLLVRQSLNYAAVNQATGQATVRTYEDTRRDADAASGATRPQDAQTQSQEPQATQESRNPGTQETQDAQGSQGAETKDTRINLNTATLEELDSINGIGPVTAQKILDYRARVGGFSSVDQLLEVSGIGTKTLEKIRAKVTV
ncbi:ComEA family DNA-binding protein [Bifidobacterium sp. 64T4]|uniref:ComEA family DNA-binding protein n=1 Tax=Bifidobacterium pongonis TaxID=2834432 RepID=UPI001C5A2E30|nr:ComEA family DNA-binding protein [Bifidobacterium pongonis]MBW3094063.1 ComEA family DNA-binding protein [Bifidobacterium pongonis]